MRWRNGYENAGTEWDKVLFILSSLWRFVCIGREEGIILLLVNFWSTPLGGTLQVIARWPHITCGVCSWKKHYFGAKAFDQKGKSICCVPPAKKNSSCEGKLKKKKKGNRFSAALKSTFFKIWFLVYLVKNSVFCVCGFCRGVVFQAEA